MKIYSYRINVDEKIQKNVQLNPFINSKEKSINTEIINALKSDKVKINELNVDINKPIISWEIFSSTSRELDNELNYRAWYDTIPRFALRPASLDSGRYIRFEKFMYESGLISSIYEHERMAIEIFE